MTSRVTRRWVEPGSPRGIADQRIVVSDTTPLNYLVLIRAVDVLPRLFDAVYVPVRCFGRLAAAAPQAVRDWARQPPGWLTVADPVLHLASTCAWARARLMRSRWRRLDRRADWPKDRSGRRVDSPSHDCASGTGTWQGFWTFPGPWRRCSRRLFAVADGQDRSGVAACGSVHAARRAARLNTVPTH